MYTNTIALAGVFAIVASAIPMAGKEKRDIIWVTETSESIVTVPVTKTVWVDAPGHYGHGHGGHRTSSVEETVVVTPSAPALAPSSTSSSEAAQIAPAASSYVAPPPAPTTTSSAWIAPTTSSAPAYVAPTTSSSVYVAPTTSSSVYVAPTTPAYVAPTTPAYVAPTTPAYVAPTTSAAPASSSAPSTGGGSGLSSGLASSGTSYTGDLTYFTPGMGACGEVSTEADHMVAISESIFDSYLAEAGGNPNKNPLCGKTLTITGTDGSPFVATVWDRCPGCAEGSLDLPEAFFNSVTYNPATGASGDGRVKNVKWSWN